MSLLSIVQSVAASVNTTIPTSIVGNSNADARQWLALAKLSLREVARRHDWQVLVNEHTFVSVAAFIQTAAYPIFFDHFVPDVVVMNLDTDTQVIGPATSDELAALGDNITPSQEIWGQIGGSFYIFPVPAAGVTYLYHYVTSARVLDADATTNKTTWAVDTDTAVIPEDLIELHLTWRWLRAHGMDYAEELSTYEREAEKAAARDRGISVLVVDRHSGRMTNWPGTIIP